jgi:hypothetical protein
VRDYAKLAPTFWTGETGRAIRRRGSEGVVVALYLMSAPGSNMLGLYYQPVLYMAHETGLGLEGASKGLADCIAEGFCHYDETTEMVWVVEMAAFQIAKQLKASDNRCAGIQRDYDALPVNPFLGGFFDHYATRFHLKNRRGGEGASKPLPSQEQEQEQEQEQKELSSLRSDSSSAAPSDLLGQKPPPGDLQARVAQITDDAIATFNASKLVKPNGGELATVSAKVGREKRQQQVRRCIRTARAICEETFGASVITRQFWETYWDEIGRDDFHAGRQRGGKGHENWRPDFEYLTREATMLKVYDRAASEDAA